MKFRSIRVGATISLVGVLVSGALMSGPASAATSTQSPKEKAAIAAYTKTMAKARADYLAAVNPSRQAALAVGKPAEAVRRAKVKAALATFKAVAADAKVPSLAAEKAYKAAIKKAAANPTDASLKAAAKASLLTLTQATAALKVDSKVAAAQAVFMNARVSAMNEFKLSVAKVAKKRDADQVRAAAKFKTIKAKALAKLKVAIKAAKAKKTK